MVNAITFDDDAVKYSHFSGSIFAVSYKAKIHIHIIDIEIELMK
jgi:hypothetical protein